MRAGSATEADGLVNRGRTTYQEEDDSDADRLGLGVAIDVWGKDADKSNDEHADGLSSSSTSLWVASKGQFGRA